jgi:hypothetical protein
MYGKALPLAAQVRIKHIAAASLGCLEQRVNETLAHLEASGGEVMMVQVMCPHGLDPEASAFIVVRTPAALDDGPQAHASSLVPNGHMPPRADSALRTARDLELGRRMQEERALAKSVRDAHPHGPLARITRTRRGEMDPGR